MDRDKDVGVADEGYLVPKRHFIRIKRRNLNKIGPVFHNYYFPMLFEQAASIGTKYATIQKHKKFLASRASVLNDEASSVCRLYIAESI